VLPPFTPVFPETARSPLFCSRDCRTALKTAHPCEERRPWATVLPEEVLLAVRAATRREQDDCGEVGKPEPLEAGMDKVNTDELQTFVISAALGAACFCASSPRELELWGNENGFFEARMLFHEVLLNMGRVRLNAFALPVSPLGSASDFDDNSNRLAVALYPVRSPGPQSLLRYFTAMYLKH